MSVKNKATILPEFRVTEFPDDTYQDVVVKRCVEDQIWIVQDDDQIRMTEDMGRLLLNGLIGVLDNDVPAVPSPG